MENPPATRSLIQPREMVQVFFLMILALVAAHYTMISSAFIITQGGGDSVLANYMLEHDWRWLIREAPDTSLFSPPMFFPVPDTAGYSDLYLGAMPIYGIWRALGAPPQTAFQFFLLTVSILNFISAYWLLRVSLKTSSLATALAASLFAFGSPRMLQMGHVQMLIAFYVVWALIGLWLIFGERRNYWTGSLLLSLSLLLQFYTAFYYAWFMAFCGAIALIYVLCVPAYRQAFIDALKAAWRPLVVASFLGALVLAPLGLEYYRTVRQLGARSYAEVAHFLPGVTAWFAQGPDHWIYGPLNRALGIDQNFGFQEMFLGVGLVTTALVVIGFVKFRDRPMIAIWGVVGAVAIIATLSWHGVSLWRFVFPLFPGASAVRAISRIGVFLLLPAAMGVALTIDWLAARLSPVVAILCVAAVFVEQAGSFHELSNYNKNQLQASIDGVVHSVGPDCKTMLFTWTAGATSVPWMHLIGMWAEQFTHVPTLNGYSGQTPPNWPIAEVGIANRFDRVRLYDGIRSWMLSHPGQMENVCWVTPGHDKAEVLRREDMTGDSFAARRSYLALLGHLPKESETASISDVHAVEALPEFRQHEGFAFAAYRALFDRDPTLEQWLAAAEDLAANRKSQEKLVEEWKASAECQAKPACASQAPDRVIRVVSELPRQVVDRDARVLLYYCLLHRGPGAADSGDSAIRDAEAAR